MSSPFYVTTPIYYINAAPHLGTAYSTIAVDVLTRYHRVRGESGFFLTGTDEHGLKIEREAKAQGLSVQEFSSKMSAPFRAIWPKLDCNYDYFVRTTDADHEKRVGEIWQRVKASIDQVLDTTTLADLCATADTPAGMAEEAPGASGFVTVTVRGANKAEPCSIGG